MALLGARLQPYAWLAGLLALAAALATADQRGYARATARAEATASAAERAYLTRLQQRIQDNAALSAHYREAREHADQDYQLALAQIDLERRRAGELGRLRDPGRPAACRPALPAAAGPAGSAAAPAPGAELSAAATGFLLDLAADADRAAAYAQACQRWVTQVRR